MDPLHLDPRKTALVLIDLQRGIVGRATLPHSSATVVSNGKRLADVFRASNALVVLVHVAFRDGIDRLNPDADAPVQSIFSNMPPDWSDFVPELGPKPNDLIITKRQWGAFYGTELDLQLRRRAVSTIVLGGISTNFGVESTAREAYERGYNQIFAEDAMSSLAADAHRFSIENVFPRIGRIRSTELILNGIFAST